MSRSLDRINRDGIEAFGRWLAETTRSRAWRSTVWSMAGSSSRCTTPTTTPTTTMTTTTIEMIDIFSVVGGVITECWIVMAGPHP